MASLAWKYSFPDNKLSIIELFYLRLIGENVTIFNPTSIIGGEAAKIYLLNKRGVNSKDGLQSVVLSRGMLVFSLIILFVVISSIFLYTAKRISLPMVFLPILALAGVLYLLFNLAKSIVVKGETKTEYKYAFWKKFVDFLVETFRSFQQNKNLGVIFFFSCAHWIVGALEFYLLFYFIEKSIDFFPVLFLDMGIVTFKSFGAFIPGQIGFEEYVNKIFLLAIDVADNATWLFICVMRRAKQLFWLLVGFILYFFVERKYKQAPGNVDGDPIHNS